MYFTLIKMINRNKIAKGMHFLCSKICYAESMKLCVFSILHVVFKWRNSWSQKQRVLASVDLITRIPIDLAHLEGEEMFTMLLSLDFVWAMLLFSSYLYNLEWKYCCYQINMIINVKNIRINRMIARIYG